MAEYSAERPLRLALIGAGIFAQDAHVPSILRQRPLFDIVAVYSRTRAKADALAANLPGVVETTTDLTALLQRDDIEALDVLLPIDVMPAVVEQALRSGKHVLSEKPIADTVGAGRRLVEVYRGLANPHQVWMVGENWRYEDAFVQAQRLVQDGAIGQPRTCHFALHLPVSPTSKYYTSTWRRSGAFRGGYLMDGGVHHVAAMRLILGEIDQVTAVLSAPSADLPPAGSLSATLRFASGAVGAYVASYAVGAHWPPYLHIAGDAGSLRVQRREIELKRGDQVETIACAGFDGVEKELVAWAAAIRHGAPHRNSPEEGLQDVAVVEAMLDSAATGRTENVLPFQRSTF